MKLAQKHVTDVFTPGTLLIYRKHSLDLYSVTESVVDVK